MEQWKTCNPTVSEAIFKKDSFSSEWVETSKALNI